MSACVGSYPEGRRRLCTMRRSSTWPLQSCPCLCLLGTGQSLRCANTRPSCLPLPMAIPDTVAVYLHIVPFQLYFAVSQKRLYKVTFHLKLLHM